MEDKSTLDQTTPKVALARTPTCKNLYYKLPPELDPLPGIDLGPKDVPETLDLMLPGTLGYYLSSDLYNRIIGGWKEFKKLFLLTEADLIKVRKHFGMQMPSNVENRVRNALWKRYFELKDIEARDGGTELKIEKRDLYTGITTSTVVDILMSRAHTVAWIVCPVPDYEAMLREAVSFGFQKLREVLDYSIYNKDGELDSKVINLQARIVALMDNRLRGAAVQKSVNVQLKGNISQPELTYDEAARKVRELEEKLKGGVVVEGEIVGGGASQNVLPDKGGRE